MNTVAYYGTESITTVKVLQHKPSSVAKSTVISHNSGKALASLAQFKKQMHCGVYKLASFKTTPSKVVIG